MTGDSAWHDALDVLAGESGDTVVVLAVWAARAADANGDAAAAEEWATKAAQGMGLLF